MNPSWSTSLSGGSHSYAARTFGRFGMCDGTFYNSASLDEETNVSLKSAKMTEKRSEKSKREKENAIETHEIEWSVVMLIELRLLHPLGEHF